MPLVRADLERLLRARRLDATLTPPAGASDRAATTGLTLLDAVLAGGWPRGHLSEVVGPRSSGRTSVAVASMAAATCRGEPVALIDTFDTFDPAHAPGLDSSWLLWVRGRAPLSIPGGRGRMGGAAARVPVVDALDRAVKATALVLQAGGFGLVVLDLADVPEPVVRGLPFTTWLRLQRLLEGRETAALLVASHPTSRSAGGASVVLGEEGEATSRWQGQGTHLVFGGVVPRGRLAFARHARGSERIVPLAANDR
jgi:recombination protein RecA